MNRVRRMFARAVAAGVAVGVAGVALVGCADDRVGRLERDIRSLKLDLDDMNAELALMTAAVDRAREAGRLRIDRNPPDFDGAAPLPKGDPNRPDIIVLSIDTLRADHMGAYGYDWETTPFFDSLAAGGTRYANQWSPVSWTLPAHTTMLSGLLPNHHGAIEDTLAIPEDVTLAQEVFHDNGYKTAGIVATLFVSSKYGFERGFDFFQDFGINDPKTNNASTVSAENVFNWALQWGQEQKAGEPAFLFLHVYDVHYQYDPPKPWSEKFDRAPRPSDARYKNYDYYLRNPLPQPQMDHQIAQYDEEIAYVDDSFRMFLATWRSTRPAIVIVTADHGEELGERGSWGHGHTLYPEQLHVPLIVNGPGVKTQTIADRSGTEDVFPTVLGLAGVRPPDAAILDGTDRSAQIRTGARPSPKATPGRYAETSRFETVRERWFESPYDLYIDLATGDREYCNVVSDPKCTKIAKDAAIEDRLQQSADAYVGAPWEAKVAGTVRVKDGVIWKGGARLGNEFAAAPGDRFAVYPGDALVKFTDGATESGPWQALGGAIPQEKDPLAFTGRHTTAAIEVSAAERAMLESLGYIQGPADGAEPSGDDAGGADTDAKSGKSGKSKAKAEGGEPGTAP